MSLRTRRKTPAPTIARAHMDSADSIFFERELEFRKAQTYDVKYPQFIARNLVPVDNSADPGADTVKYEQFDFVGLAKIVSSYADDLPVSEVKGKEFRQPLKSLGTSFRYSLQEIRAARFAGKPLEQRRANAARRAFEFAVDTIAAVGDSVHELKGLLNQTNAQSFTVPNGASTTTPWSTKTPTEILADMNGITNQVVNGTNGVELPDTLLLPISQYTKVATTPLGTGGITVTILKFFLENNPWVKTVIPWYRLAGAGAAATDRMVCYRRDPDALQLLIPVEFEMLPLQVKGFSFVTPCHGRIGGVISYYPMSICYGDGI